MTILELLSDRSRWTKLAMARDAAGVPVGVTSGAATCWCLSAAVAKCYDNSSAIRRKILDELDRMGFNRLSIPAWNDYHATYEEVVELARRLKI